MFTVSEAIASKRLLVGGRLLRVSSLSDKRAEKYVDAYPEGGGFARPIRVSDIEAIGDDAVAKFEASQTWRIAKFGAAWFFGESVEAYVLGESINGAYRWNGWAKPMMTRSQVEKLVQLQHENENGTTFSWRGDVLVVHDEDEDAYEIQPQKIDGLPEAVYDVQLGWTWDEDTDD